MEERSRKTFINTVLNLLQQLATVICGLILPVLIIRNYGSAVNGTVSSITQFLSYITLLESGVGGVIKAALYKPLADKDTQKLSGIVKATEQFFQTIAKVFLIYLLVVAVGYPLLVSKQFGWFFTFSLVIIISISIFAQYYFGLTYQLVIQADQKMYITSALQIVTMLLNVLLTFICVKFGAEIHVLKLVTTVVFVLRPLFFNYYVKKHYSIIKNAVPDKEAIKQRWDGLGQHIAFIIHSNTDVTVLTIFTNVLEVSVYTVYYNVVYGIVNVVNSFSNGISASIGNLIAMGEKEKLNHIFDIYEVLNFLLITIFFTTTGLLILPFVQIYTAQVHDVNYYRPLFAVLIVMAEGAYCLRNPYSTVVFAAGHFKQTTRGAYLEAAINIILSVLFVIKFGMVGVAMGTLIAMLVRSCQYVHYLSKNILYRSIWIFIKKMLITVACILLSIGCVKLIPSFPMTNYLYWAMDAVIVFTVTALITLLLYFLFYKESMKEAAAMVLRIFKRKRS